VDHDERVILARDDQGVPVVRHEDVARKEKSLTAANAHHSARQRLEIDFGG